MVLPNRLHFLAGACLTSLTGAAIGGYAFLTGQELSALFGLCSLQMLGLFQLMLALPRRAWGPPRR